MRIGMRVRAQGVLAQSSSSRARREAEINSVEFSTTTDKAIRRRGPARRGTVVSSSGRPRYGGTRAGADVRVNPMLSVAAPYLRIIIAESV